MYCGLFFDFMLIRMYDRLSVSLLGRNLLLVFVLSMWMGVLLLRFIMICVKLGDFWIRLNSVCIWFIIVIGMFVLVGMLVLGVL